MPKSQLDEQYRCSIDLANDGYLNLSTVHDDDVEAICEALKEKELLGSPIRTLWLDDCNLHDEGAKLLAQLLPESVIELVVSRNSLNDEGAIALIRRDPPILDLSFENTGGEKDITEETGRVILEEAKQTRIYLSGTVLSKNVEMMKKIEAKLAANRDALKAEAVKLNPATTTQPASFFSSEVKPSSDQSTAPKPNDSNPPQNNGGCGLL